MTQTLALSEKYLNVYRNSTSLLSTTHGDINAVDVLTSLGVRVWNPFFRDWTEISVTGKVYECRVSATIPGKHLPHRSNELLSGSIIDLCGAYLLYKHANNIANIDAVSPSTIISTINRKNPQCPVLLRPISVKYLSDRERLLSAFNSCNQIDEPNNFSAIHKGKLFATDVTNSETVPFVFTACGHVHAYSKELIGRLVNYI